MCTLKLVALLSVWHVLVFDYLILDYNCVRSCLFKKFCIHVYLLHFLFVD